MPEGRKEGGRELKGELEERKEDFKDCLVSSLNKNREY